MRIALVTCLDPPQEDFDAPDLLAALQARGHHGSEAAWDDGGVDWGSFDAALVRSRVDLLRDAAGGPCLLECELVEPSLFFAAAPGSAARLVEALAARCGGAP